MSKIHELAFNAEEIDELLDSVDKKTIYQDVTQSEHGLMSATDKSKLDALPTAQQIDDSFTVKVDKEEGKGLSTNDYTDADKAKVASALQSETDPTVPSWAKQPNKPSYDYSEIGNTPDISGFITKSVNDLTNYYLKSETYTKAEVAALIGAIQQFHYEIYATLPQTGQGNVLYLIGPTGSGSDRYEEYVYSNSAFTKIGDTSIDLSGYVTTSALNIALANYTTTDSLTTLLLGKQDVLTFDIVPTANSDNPVKSGGVYVELQEKADKIPVAYSIPNDGMLPNVLYNFGELSSNTTFTLAAATDNTVMNVWRWKFGTGNTVPTIILPSGLAWEYGEEPVFEPNQTYLIVVTEGIATCISTVEVNRLINGILFGLQNGLPSLRVEELTITRKLDAYIKEGNALTSGAGAPTILPQFNGQEYFDTTNKVWYKASYTGTEPTASAWKQITN